MSEEIVKSANTVQPCVARTDHENYRLTIGGSGKSILLRRGTDFGKFGRSKSPTLLKAGAEKILLEYGITTKFFVENAVEHFGEDGSSPFFFYRIRGEFWKGDTLITTTLASANSRESACGRASAFDVANQRIKVCRKRALVDGAILIAGIAGIFTADLEDSNLETSDFQEVAKSVVKPTEKISAKQVKRLYTLCTQNSVDSETAAKIIADAGYDSAKSILNRDYDSICNKIESFSETVVEGEVVK
nr:MAG TPA: hypothetical protein [Bacteriophage sp.]